jgi:uncharacterized protein (TIGR03435 family)
MCSAQLRCLAMLAYAILLGITAYAQPPPAPQSFDVASIRINRSGDRIMLFNPTRGGKFTAQNCSLSLLITFAYDVMQSHISGAPDWLKSERYDIAATAARDASVSEIRAMLQKLLEDRFQLKSHGETREGSVYDLVVSHAGKLKPAASGECPSTFDAQTTGPPADAPCGSLRNSPGHTKGYRLTSAQLADSLSFFLQEPVLDKTGLPGNYDIELDWTPENIRMTPPTSVETGPPSIFTAVQEQLGLRLIPAKGPVSMLVIDHVARPSEN